MTLLPLFQWLGAMPVGVFMQQSTYGFEVAEMFHLLALSALGGAILIINLRVLGLGFAGFKKRPALELATELRPYVLSSLAVMLLSGVLLLAGEAEKCYYNTAFRLKMLFLALALAFYFGVQGRLMGAERGAAAKAAGVVSLMLWLAVGLAGRAIGLL
jgi:hypothetical protein